MSVLVYIDQQEGKIKKSSLEAISYGAQLAARLSCTIAGVIVGSTKEDLTTLGAYDLQQVYHADQSSLDAFDSQSYTQVIAQAAAAAKSTVVVFSHSVNGKALAPRISVRLNAGLVSGAIGLPENSAEFIVKRPVFSGKAFSRVVVKTPVKVISLIQNSFGIQETGGKAEVVRLDTAGITPKVKVTGVEKVSGQVPLSEAELVVSGGRGLKGPENWALIEDLANALGASTACSRPVADAHWRPHHEHVGQTGGSIAPKLYFAVGISGAIQHLAGVNRSKVIVVINKDPEAPFFKAADYGIVGDAFEVVPKITSAIRKLRNS